MSDANMQYVTSTSFLLLTYAKYLTSAHTVVNCGGTAVTPKTLRTIAKKQVKLRFKFTSKMVDSCSFSISQNLKKIYFLVVFN